MPDGMKGAASRPPVYLDHLCAVLGKNMRANCAQCVQFSSIVLRNQICVAAKCDCAWRRCCVCVTQGVTDERAVVVDKNTGLCSFHTENGETANRSWSTPAPASGAQRSPAQRGRAPAAADRRAEVSTPPPPAERGAPSAPKPAPIAATSAASSTAPSPRPTPKPPAATSVVPAPASDQVVGRVVRVPVNRIRRFEGQPREEFDPAELESLRDSIKKRGQLKPALLVEVLDDLNIDYQVVDGERRWIACRMAGVGSLIGIVFDGVTVEEAKRLYEMSVMANFHQSKHTPLEIAKACHRLIHEHGHTHAEVRLITGLSVTAIGYHLKLLRLDPEVQAMMRIDPCDPGKKILQLGHALLLLDYGPDFQKIVGPEILRQGLNYNRAGYHVRKRAVELGATRKNRTRATLRPSDHHRAVMEGIRRTYARLSAYAELPEMSLVEVFKRRPPADRQEARELLERIIRILEKMKDDVGEDPVLESAA